MFVDFHGAYKPTGLHRTYPNVINYEGVHGLEQMKWSAATVNQVEYDVTIPFIRMLAGPFDYTQGAMRNASRSNYRPVNSEPMSQGTRCRQLAEFVVFDSPFSMLCDSPSNYLAEPECTEYIAKIPTTWDETRVLDGKVGDYIATARRKGDTWYVGAMTDWSRRDLELDLSFLPAGTYSVTVYRDGPNADKAARDFAIDRQTLASPKAMSIHMASGGGWVAVFTKK
jgi:alpha-glucosidase